MGESLLTALAKEAGLAAGIERMFAGEHLNNTEDRSVFIRRQYPSQDLQESIELDLGQLALHTLLADEFEQAQSGRRGHGQHFAQGRGDGAGAQGHGGIVRNIPAQSSMPRCAGTPAW